MTRPQWLPSSADRAGIVLSAALGALALGVTRALPPSPLLSDVLIALGLGALVTNVNALRRLVGLAPPGGDRESDRYAPGLRFTGKWLLRGAIVLMGFKMQTKLFGAHELLLIALVCVACLPSAFLVAHAVGAMLGIRRPLADLLAGGTMICGASAVNAVTPVVGARREEAGVAIGAVFLFSVVALVAFHPIAVLVGLDSAHAGLWSGLAVNDLSSAVAVGQQMGGAGGTMAAASKSARIVLLAPTLFAFALLRHRSAPGADVGKRAADHLPGFLLGYAGLALARALLDRYAAGAHALTYAIGANRFLVDLLMCTVTASIGLHLEGRRLLASGWRALAVGGATSMWMATLSLAMVALSAHGMTGSAAALGAGALVVGVVFFRAKASDRADDQRLAKRFAEGERLSIAEATRLLDWLDHRGSLDDETLRRMMALLSPSLGELIPVRSSPHHHGDGCRWATFWEGKCGWALVAVSREAGSETPIHAHSHRLFGKSIEGAVEELRFAEERDDRLRLVSRRALEHGELVETDGLATLHMVRAVGGGPTLDLQLRGPESGAPGRRFRTLAAVDYAHLDVGALVAARAEVDDRPGHQGDGAAAGRLPAMTSSSHSEPPSA